MSRYCPSCAKRVPDEGVFCPDDGARAFYADPKDPWSGRLVDGRWRVLERLGCGGNGTVYRAVHADLRREVALKVLRRELVSNLEVRARFAREARALSRLAHPGCVAVHDFAAYGKDVFLVMELIDGEPLAAVLSTGRAQPARAVRTLVQLLDALEHAHRAGVVHRDLKPENIFVIPAGDGQGVKIADFGLAKIVTPQANETLLTAQGQCFGTPSYMAPEQVAGGRIGPATDIYAASVILYEMLVGVPPYRAMDPRRRASQHVLDPVPDVHGANPGLSRELAWVVTTGLAKRPGDRWSSATAMADAIRNTPEWRSGRTPREHDHKEAPEAGVAVRPPAPVDAHGGGSPPPRDSQSDRVALLLPGRDQRGDEESTLLGFFAVDPETAQRRRRRRRLAAGMFAAGIAAGALTGGLLLALQSL